jgi:hypothetical protein
MAGAMTQEEKQEDGGLEEVQTPKENGELMIYAHSGWKFAQHSFKKKETSTLFVFLKANSSKFYRLITCTFTKF